MPVLPSVHHKSIRASSCRFWQIESPSPRTANFTRSVAAFLFKTALKDPVHKFTWFIPTPLSLPPEFNRATCPCAGLVSVTSSRTPCHPVRREFYGIRPWVHQNLILVLVAQQCFHVQRFDGWFPAAPLSAAWPAKIAVSLAAKSCRREKACPQFKTPAFNTADISSTSLIIWSSCCAASWLFRKCRFYSSVIPSCQARLI